jgi:hypothetical protein
VSPDQFRNEQEETEKIEIVEDRHLSQDANPVDCAVSVLASKANESWLICITLCFLCHLPFNVFVALGRDGWRARSPLI